MENTQAAADDAASVARLQKAVENSGASYQTYSGQLDDVIKKGQKLGFTDDQTRASLSLLVAQTGSTSEAMKRFAIAQDLARGAGIDLETASKLLGKVTEENVNVLGRYGITVKEGATETELFGAITEKFGGQAEEFGKSTAGAAERTKIAFSEMREEMGTRLVPVLGAALQGFSALPGPMQTGVAALMQFGPAIGQMAFGFTALAPALGMARTAIMGMSMAMLAPPMGIVIALVAVGVAAYIFRDQIIGAFGAAWNFVSGAAAGIANTIVGAFNSVLDFFKSHWREIATLIALPFAPLVALATDAFGVRSALIKALGAIAEYVREWIDKIRGLIGDLYDWLRGVQSSISSFFSSIPTSIGGVTGKASGGPVMAGMPYIVGERGPELFVPGSSGNIVTNEKLSRSQTHGMGGQVNVNIYGQTIIQNIGDQKDASGTLKTIGYAIAADLRSRGMPVFA